MQWFSNKGDFASAPVPTPGNIWRCLEMVFAVTWGGGGGWEGVVVVVCVFYQNSVGNTASHNYEFSSLKC